MTERIYNVLFLCTGNSARSIIAEAILNKIGAGNFAPFQRGSQPKGQVNPFALKASAGARLRPSTALRSKSWDEFAEPGAPEMDFVFTVCDNAAGESLPGLARPADDGALGRRGSGGGRGHRAEKEAAFIDAFRYAQEPHRGVHGLPMRSARPLALQHQAARHRPHGRRDHGHAKAG